jgi:hypothetical protein
MNLIQSIGEQIGEVCKIHVTVGKNTPSRHDFCRAKQTPVRICKATFNHYWSKRFHNRKHWLESFLDSGFKR